MAFDFKILETRSAVDPDVWKNNYVKKPLVIFPFQTVERTR